MYCQMNYQISIRLFIKKKKTKINEINVLKKENLYKETFGLSSPWLLHKEREFT